MKISHTRVAVITCLLLISTQAKTATVWHNAAFTDYGTPVDFYIVTDFDDPAQSQLGQLLDVYLDFNVPNGLSPSSSIDPADLLIYNSAQLSVIHGDLFDVTGTSSPFGGPIPYAVSGGSTNMTLEGLHVQMDQPYTQSPEHLELYCDRLNLGACIVPQGKLFDPTFLFPTAQIFGDMQFTAVATSAVPIPAAMWLFGSGLLGLIGVARKKAHA